MRPTPSISAMVRIQQAKVGEFAVPIRPSVGIDVLAEQVDLAHALCGQLRHFHHHVLERAADFSAAGVGHHAERAVFGTAFHDRHECRGTFGARLRQAVELLDLGKLMSTCGRFCSRRARISSGRRCRVCGPNTRSTNGARLMIASPSCEATQPPTPMMTSRPLFFRPFHTPSWLNTFSCAFSRMEQVLTRMTSASSGLSVSSGHRWRQVRRPSWRESYSFIWQPWVLMYSLPLTWSGLRGPAGRATSVPPGVAGGRRLASRSWRLIHSGGGKAGNSTRIPRAARLR